MRTRIGAFLVLAVTLFALNNGLGHTKLATAAGVDTISVNSASCSGGTADVSISWPTLNQGAQYIYWSLQNNGFQAGTYTALGPLQASASSALVQDLPLNANVYMMVGTVVGGQLQPGRTMVFSTSNICQSMGQSGHSGSAGPFDACGFPFGDHGFGFDPSHGPIPHQFSPFDYIPFFHDFDDENARVFDFDDEDEDDEDEDEHDFDEDEDDDDESDGDESDEDESDEDESDEDESDESDEGDEDDDNFFLNKNFVNPCLFFGGHQAGLFGGHHPGFFGGHQAGFFGGGIY